MHAWINRVWPEQLFHFPTEPNLFIAALQATSALAEAMEAHVDTQSAGETCDIGA